MVFFLKFRKTHSVQIRKRVNRDGSICLYCDPQRLWAKSPRRYWVIGIRFDVLFQGNFTVAKHAIRNSQRKIRLDHEEENHNKFVVIVFGLPHWNDRVHSLCKKFEVWGRSIVRVLAVVVGEGMREEQHWGRLWIWLEEEELSWREIIPLLFW